MPIGGSAEVPALREMSSKQPFPTHLMDPGTFEAYNATIKTEFTKYQENSEAKTRQLAASLDNKNKRRNYLYVGPGLFIGIWEQSQGATAT